MSSQYNGFIYQWTNQTNNKKYIGSHYGHENDGYIGSGKWFLRAYNKNPDHFKREILEYVEGPHRDILIREQHYLDMITNITSNKEYYNISPNAKGGSNHTHLSDADRAALYKKWHAASMQRLAEMSPQEKEELADRKRATWQAHTEIREKHSKNTRQRRLNEEATKSSEEKTEFKNKMKEAYYSRSTDIIKKQHQAQSNGIKAWHQNMDPELAEQRRRKMKETRNSRKLRWIYHPETQQRSQVSEVQLDDFVKQGWQKGMGPRISPGVPDV